MTQKEQIASLEQRVQALENQLRKVVRTERNEQSSGTVKPLPNRRQDRLAKLEGNVADFTNGGTVYAPSDLYTEKMPESKKSNPVIILKDGGEGERVD